MEMVRRFIQITNPNVMNIRISNPINYPFFSFNFFNTSVCMFDGISIYW